MKNQILLGMIFISCSLEASQSDKVGRYLVGKHKEFMRLLQAEKKAYAGAVCSVLYASDDRQMHKLSCMKPLCDQRKKDLDRAFGNTQKWLDKNPGIIFPMYNREEELEIYRSVRKALK